MNRDLFTRPRLSRPVAGFAAIALAAAFSAAAQGSDAGAGRSAVRSEETAKKTTAETLEYEWRLQGVAGFFARLFIPGKGDGVLVTRPAGEGLLETELRITSPKAEDEEYWYYGSTLDPETERTVAAWNESNFRGRVRQRSTEIDDADTLDIPTGIRFMRVSPPEEAVRRRLWADGKVYPVEIRREGRERREIGEREVVADRFSVRGVEVAGERFWDGGLDVWMTTGENPVPVQILYRSGRGKVDLELRELPGND